MHFAPCIYGLLSPFTVCSRADSSTRPQNRERPPPKKPAVYRHARRVPDSGGRSRLKGPSGKGETDRALDRSLRGEKRAGRALKPVHIRYVLRYRAETACAAAAEIAFALPRSGRFVEELQRASAWCAPEAAAEEYEERMREIEPAMMRTGSASEEADEAAR